MFAYEPEGGCGIPRVCGGRGDSEKGGYTGLCERREKTAALAPAAGWAGPAAAAKGDSGEFEVLGGDERPFATGDGHPIVEGG